MFLLTYREQQIVVVFFLIFLLGLGVKQWRAHHSISLLKKSTHAVEDGRLAR
ncbi:MAG: hypothetical protein K2W99_02065 [Chthoniobacterales bacterium]|nr:hypothetical protein [Chthoniobacterales bacterium]